MTAAIGYSSPLTAMTDADRQLAETFTTYQMSRASEQITAAYAVAPADMQLALMLGALAGAADQRYLCAGLDQRAPRGRSTRAHRARGQVGA